MVDCIAEFPGTIGYADSGHGLSQGMQEVSLSNEYGTLQTSAEAVANGGVASAEEGVLPKEATDDFSTVSLLNRPGMYTWPLILMTYVYVRKDLSYMDDPQEQSLLMAFLRALYDDEYMSTCQDKYGFLLPSDQVRAFGLRAIEELERGLHPDSIPWTFEVETTPIVGAGDYVISHKRNEISDIDRQDLLEENRVKDLRLADLEESLATVLDEIKALKQQGGAAQQASSVEISSVDDWGDDFGSTEEQMLKIAFFLSIFSIGFWILLFVCCVYQYYGYKNMD